MTVFVYSLIWYRDSKKILNGSFGENFHEIFMLAKFRDIFHHCHYQQPQHSSRDSVPPALARARLFVCECWKVTVIQGSLTLNAHSGPFQTRECKPCLKGDTSNQIKSNLLKAEGPGGH